MSLHPALATIIVNPGFLICPSPLVWEFLEVGVVLIFLCLQSRMRVVLPTKKQCFMNDRKSYIFVWFLIGIVFGWGQRGVI
jgi:hypothetical protein